MRKNRSTGTIFFASATQAALFEHELKGQFSDGMWENTYPYDHWVFWCGLYVQVCSPGRAPRVETWCSKAITKRSYGISRLYKHVGERMLAIGRFTRALTKVGGDWASYTHGTLRSVAEYMPPTLEEWRHCKKSGLWQYDFVDAYMASVNDELAQAFYSVNYTQRDLSHDVKAIMAAMANVVDVEPPAT